MREDQPLGQITEPTKTPQPTESPSRKRLLADPKPKLGLALLSTDSSLSSDSSSDRIRKKTRDLPNLSDCHSCGVHINNTNPRDKLQTLASVWRVVLLCRKCIKRVDSAKLCSYCFSEADSDCYRCRDCDRCVHMDCVVRYECSPPWSYCSSELGFSVCVDCWVPKLLANSIRVRTRKRNRCGVLGGPKLLEDVVNDAERAVEKKAAVAAMAKENVLRKAVVARRAMELANGALELVTKKDDNSAKNESSVTSSNSAADAADITVVDAELAIQLHRAMNSSPRRSKNMCLINSSCLPVSRMRDCKGNSSVMISGSRGCSSASVSGKFEQCPSSRLDENTDATVSEPSVYVRPSDGGTCVSLWKLKQGGLVYTRRRKKDKEYRENVAGIVAECNTGDDITLIIESRTCCEEDKLERELHPDGSRDQNQLTCHGNASLLHDGSSCNVKLDRYLLKYSKRCAGSKACSSNAGKILSDDFYVGSESHTFEKQKELIYELHPDDSRNQNQVACHGNAYDVLHDGGRCNGKLDRCRLKYSKRPVGMKASSNNETRILCDALYRESKLELCNHYRLKYSKRPVGMKASSNNETRILCDALYRESKARAVQIPLNCSEERRTLSGASFQSYPVSLQASACASVSSQYPL